MDDQRFLKARQLQEEGKLREALDEFSRIAEDTKDEIDKGGVLLTVAATLRALGEFNLAKRQLSEIRALAPLSHVAPSSIVMDDRVVWLVIGVEIEDAEIYRCEGNETAALTKLDDLLSRYGRKRLDSDFRAGYEIIQTHRAFVLVNLGRWREALPILEEAESFEGRKAEIDYYLGHCFVCDEDYSRAQGKLVEALKVGLPKYLEFRAHCELGMVYSRLEDYVHAKLEFEKSAETAQPEYIKQARLWKRLESTCRILGLKEEANRYAALATQS